MRYEICAFCDNRHTWVILISTTTNIPSFITAAHTELWIFAFLLLTNQNRYANEVLDMHIQWRQTSWVVLLPIPTHKPSFVTVAIQNSEYLTLLLLAKLICKWGIKYVHLEMTYHVGNTFATHHHYSRTKFCHYSPYRTLDICLIVISNQNKYENEVLNMRIWWQQTMWEVLLSTTTNIPSSVTVAIQNSRYLFVFSQSEQICKWSITYAYSVTTDHIYG